MKLSESAGVSEDGAKTDILATGFRAPNGVCINPDGNFWGYHDITDSSDAAMAKPVCWITNAFDRSPAEMLWVTSDRWGPLNGSLLNFSYGNGKVFIVPHEKIEGNWQGGMSPLPIPQFPTGVM